MRGAPRRLRHRVLAAMERCRTWSAVAGAMPDLPDPPAPAWLESHSAQSSALRAAPRGIACCSPARSSTAASASRTIARLRPASPPRLAVARIGHALAASDMAAAAKFRHDHRRLCLGAAADGEAAGDWPALDAGGEVYGSGCHGRRSVGEGLACLGGAIMAVKGLPVQIAGIVIGCFHRTARNRSRS